MSEFKLLLEGSDGKYSDGTDVQLSNEIFEAFLELFTAGLCDKTFLLMLAFTLCWTNVLPDAKKVDGNWKDDENAEVDEKAKLIRDEKLRTEVKRTNEDIQKKLEELNLNPLMITLASIIGSLVCLFWTLFRQENIYDNTKRLFSAVLLILCLMSYTYELVGAHLMRIGNKDKLKTKINKEVKKLGQLESVKLAIEE